MSIANLNSTSANDVICRSLETLDLEVSNIVAGKVATAQLAVPPLNANLVTWLEAVDISSTLQAVTLAGSQWDFAGRITFARYTRIDETVTLIGNVLFPNGTTGSGPVLDLRLQNLPYPAASGTATGVITSNIRDSAHLVNAGIGLGGAIVVTTPTALDIQCTRIVAALAANANEHVLAFTISYNTA